MKGLEATSLPGVFVDLDGNVYYIHKGQMEKASAGVYFIGVSFLKQASILVKGEKRTRTNVATLMWNTFREGYVERSHKIVPIDGDPNNCKLSNLKLIKYTDTVFYNLKKVKEAVGDRYINNEEVLNLFPTLYEEEGKVYTYEVVLPNKDKVVELEGLTPDFLKGRSVVASKAGQIEVLNGDPEDIKTLAQGYLEEHYKVKVIPTNFLERMI